MKLFRNKKIEDLEEKVQSLNEYVVKLNEEKESIIDRLRLVEYELRNPKPYKIGDKWDKDNVVTNVELVRKTTFYLFDLKPTFIAWEIEITNKKTGEKNIKIK